MMEAKTAMDEHIVLIHSIMTRYVAQYTPVQGSISTDDFKIAVEDFNVLQLKIDSLQNSFLYTEGLHINTLGDYYAKYIEPDVRVERILHRTVAEFRIRRHLIDTKWQELCANVAQSIYLGMATKSTNLSVIADKHLATPIEMVEKLTTPDENLCMLIANPWLPVCILFSMSDSVIVTTGGRTNKP